MKCPAGVDKCEWREGLMRHAERQANRIDELYNENLKLRDEKFKLELELAKKNEQK